MYNSEKTEHNNKRNFNNNSNNSCNLDNVDDENIDCEIDDYEEEKSSQKEKSVLIKNTERFKVIQNLLRGDLLAAERIAYSKERESLYLYFMEKIQNYIHYIIRKKFSNVIDCTPVYNGKGGFSYSEEYNNAVTDVLAKAIFPNIEKYDATKYTLTTFYKPYILEVLTKMVYDTTKKHSKYYAENMKAIREAKKELEDLGYSEGEITNLMIAEKTGLSLKSITNAIAMEAASNHVDFDPSLEVKSNSTYASPEDYYLQKERESLLLSMLNILTDAEKYVVYCTYGFNGKPMTHQEVGVQSAFINIIKNNKDYATRIPIRSGKVKIKTLTKFYPEYIAFSDVKNINDTALQKLTTSATFQSVFLSKKYTKDKNEHLDLVKSSEDMEMVDKDIKILLNLEDGEDDDFFSNCDITF